MVRVYSKKDVQDAYNRGYEQGRFDFQMDIETNNNTLNFCKNCKLGFKNLSDDYLCKKCNEHNKGGRK